MAFVNVVHMRVKPGMEDEFIRFHSENMKTIEMAGLTAFSLVRSGERSFIVIGEWESGEALVAARPAMIANLDRVRPMLEDLGGGRGVTEPWSGEVALRLAP